MLSSENKTGSYLRLSREDGDKLESDSIKNQRELIKEYAAQHESIHLIEEYVDDGFSGTTYERPDFQRLITDIKAGKINCIIVKDLSRMGRNYIETGRYLEKIFPLMGVRVISILDNYDSFNSDSEYDKIIIPFKNLINDSYCRDISAKIRSQFDVKRKNGKFIGSFASYGYKKDPEDNNHLVIDPYAADIVRMIFRMKLAGSNQQRIAEKLNSMGILPPAEYKRSQGYNYDCGYRTGKNPKWEITSINRILVNEIYTGTMVQGLNRKINYKVKRSQAVPKDEWIRVENTHEPIIEKELFDTVQRLLQLETRTAPDKGEIYLFSGLVVCGDCGQNMVRRKVKKNGKDYAYLHCRTHKKGEGCSPHQISAEKLELIVLSAIQVQIELLVRAESILKTIDYIPEEQTFVKTVTCQIEELDKEIERYQALEAQAYSDKKDAVITDDEYHMITKRFSYKLNDLTEKKNQLQDTKIQLLKNKIHLKPWIQDFKKYRNIEKLDRSLVVELIDRIIVYDKTNIFIQFRHRDEIQEILSLSEVESVQGLEDLA